MFGVLQNYYNRIWNKKDLNKVVDYFHDDIVLKYTALDLKSESFEFNGVKNVYSSYASWDKMANRLETVVKRFDVKLTDAETYKVEYIIEQEHNFNRGQNTSNKYCLNIEDNIHFVKNSDNEWVIDRIDAYRHSKIDL